MAERMWVMEPLQKRFQVEMRAASRERRNRSFSNASPCCEAKLCQVKRCSACEKEVDASECRHKIVKVGKSEHIIDGDTLKGLLPEEGDIVFHTVLDRLPDASEDWFDSLDFATPVKKREREYAELAELLKGRYAVGKGVFRSNEFQVVATTGKDGIIRSRRLIDSDQKNELPSIGQLPEPDAAVLDVERQILGKRAASGFDFSQFRDRRVEQEEQVIEEFVLHGKRPEKVVEEVKKQAADDELARLRALL
jgi:hypothetical protein